MHSVWLDLLKMKIIGINVWEVNPINVKNFLARIKNEKCDRIVYFAQNEWEFWKTIYYDTMVDAANEAGHKLDIITGAHKTNVLYMPRRHDVNVHHWSTYWFNKTYKQAFADDSEYQHRNNFIDLDDVTEYKYHFISMNHNVHPWRARMIDLLYNAGLFDKGAISWMNNIVGENYYWRFWNPEKMILDDFSETKNQYAVPTQYYESFAQLVNESPDERAIIFSEKTAIPLIFGKPFLVATTRHHHASLKELGFELYNEIFDYSFDDEPDEEYRYKQVINNFKKLCRIDKQDLKYLHHDIKEKVDFNKRHAYKLSTDFSYYPDIAKDVVQIFDETGEVVDRDFIHIHDKLSGKNRLSNCY